MTSWGLSPHWSLVHSPSASGGSTEISGLERIQKNLIMVEEVVDNEEAKYHRRPSMASPAPVDIADHGKVTDEDFETLQNFDWSNTRPEILADLEFIARLPDNAALDYEALGPSLPKKHADAPPKTLFIDLDETIAHTSLDDLEKARTPELVFASEGDNATAHVYFRPWVKDFLRITSQYYEIILYTASLKPYGKVSIWYISFYFQLIWYDH